MEEKQEKQEERQPGRSVYEWVQALVCSVLAAVLLFTFGVRIVGVSGASMRETLQNGDMLLVVNGILCREYRQGDIVIAAKASFENGEPIVKRVIATEGQTVDVDFVNGVVSVDGTALSEPYIREETHLSEGTEFPLTVPEGCVFLMGDNRNDSRDSRDPLLGAVDTRNLIGRAVFLLVPGETAGLEDREWNRIGSLC
ncbi:MAG: signal peptidase I [Oscillibacter sp.]|nr:signal peptidase I [Oscillibacter sp.]